MNIRKKLTVPVGSELVTIDFGHPTTDAEIQSLFELRYKVYSKYSYLDETQFQTKSESDQYDTDNRCVYFAAYVGTRPIGFVRLVQGNELPIQKFYTFTTPAEIALAPQPACELGRLVVDKYSEEAYLPRNLVLLFLTLCLAEYSEQHDIHFAYAFLKKKLMNKLRTLGLPFTLIEPFELIYPHTGVMAPYFYNKDDPAEPSYFSLEPVKKFLDKTIHNKSLFVETATNHFTLQTNLYTRFLKTIGVI